MAMENTSLMQRLLVTEQCALLGQATAEIAHEMGNQLNLLPLVELIEDEYSHDAQLLQLAKMARDSHERLFALVNEIKGIIRQERADVSLQLVSLADVVRELLSFLRFNRDIPAASIVADLRCDPVILGNKLKLHQVLLNLVKNAIDAIHDKPNGQIAIHLGCSSDNIQLSIADNGTGIPAAIQGKIFDPFFSTKGKQGNGLGLDLVKRLVEAQHGHIELHSVLGQGSEFTITFPIIASPPEELIKLAETYP